MNGRPRLGDGWIAAPSLTLAHAKADLARYRTYCEQQQHTIGARVIRRDIYMGASAAEAAATGGPVVAGGYRGFAPEATIIGDAVAVADAFLALGAMGFTHILVRNLVPTQAHALACIERLARVKELVNDW